MGPIAFSVAAIIPPAISLTSQLRTTAASEDVEGLSLANQWIGLANQCVWLVWGILVANEQVVMVGLMCLVLIVANVLLATLRKNGTWGPVRRDGLRLSFRPA